MRKFILIIVFVSLYAMIYSQDQTSTENIIQKNEIGIFLNIGICQPIGSHEATDFVTPHGKGAFSLGLKYCRPFSRKFQLEAGICYAKYIIVNHLVDYPIEDFLTESIRTITIPILLKRYYPKNYLVSFGSIIDFGLSRKGSYEITDAQTGFGLSFGAGKTILIGKFSLEITPNLDIHSLIPFSSHLFQQRLLALGLKISFNYRLDK